MKKIIGLTGKSGAGKGAVSRILKSMGAYTIDADVVARNVVEKGKPALLEIKNCFGEGVLLENGELNRKALARIVFNSGEELHKLNTITHKYITEEIVSEINSNDSDIFVIDAAALIESGIDKMCDKIICVTADESVRTKRIIERDSLSIEEAKDRISAQKEDSFYILKSDYNIQNNGAEDELVPKVQQIIEEVCSE